MIKNVTRVELPNGTCMTLEGHTAEQAAAAIREELGGTVVQTTNERKKKSSLVTNLPPHVQALLGMNSTEGEGETRVCNVQPLELPSMTDEPKDNLHPAGIVRGPNVNQTPTVNENEAEEEAAYYRAVNTLNRISGPVFDDDVDALPLPEMKFDDQPDFMNRKYKDDEPAVEPLEMPDPILAN
jgi:hypothetical protein